MDIPPTLIALVDTGGTASQSNKNTCMVHKIML